MTYVLMRSRRWVRISRRLRMIRNVYAWRPKRTNNVHAWAASAELQSETYNQHLMYWIDSYAGQAESAVQFIWHMNLYIPPRAGRRTKRTVIQSTRIEIHTTRTILAIPTIRGSASPHKKLCKKRRMKREEKTTQKRTPPPPDDDSEGSDIEVRQSNPARKRRNNILSSSILLLQFLMKINLTMPVSSHSASNSLIS